MKFIAKALIASTILAAPFAAMAQDSKAPTLPGTFTGGVGMTSDYVFRGISQSDENPAIQGNLDWNLSIDDSTALKVGVWGSNVDFNDGDEASTEFDIYAGVTKTFGKANVGGQVLYYAYPGAASGLNYDFLEFTGSAGYDFDVVAVNASIAYSPNYFADSDTGLYYRLGASAPLPCNFVLDGHIGYQTINDNTAAGVPDYTDWALGVGYTISGVNLKLEYIDTNLSKSDIADGAEARTVFTVSKSF
jgi:uncharacterized protein (TIGR02001 family)